MITYAAKEAPVFDPGADERAGQAGTAGNQAGQPLLEDFLDRSIGRRAI